MIGKALVFAFALALSSRVVGHGIEVPPPVEIESGEQGSASKSVIDGRPGDEQATQVVEERNTVTFFLGDDLISPPGPRLLAIHVRRKLGDGFQVERIRLATFLVSVEGRDENALTRGPFSFSPPAIWFADRSAGANIVVNVLLSAWFMAMNNLPKNYVIDVLRVHIEGEIDGLPFRGSASLPVEGKLMAGDLANTVRAAVEEAVHSMAGTVSAELRKTEDAGQLP